MCELTLYTSKSNACVARVGFCMARLRPLHPSDGCTPKTLWSPTRVAEKRVMDWTLSQFTTSQMKNSGISRRSESLKIHWITMLMMAKTPFDLEWVYIYIYIHKLKARCNSWSRFHLEPNIDKLYEIGFKICPSNAMKQPNNAMYILEVWTQEFWSKTRPDSDLTC